MSINVPITLLNTAPAGALGSMARYAELVEQALRLRDCNVQLINLGLSTAQQQTIAPRLHTWANHYYAWQALRRQRQQWQDSIIHLLDGSYAYLLNALPHHNTVVTVHDIIPQLQINHTLPGPNPSLPARWLIRRSLQGIAQAKQRICDSQATQRDLAEHINIPATSTQIIHPPVQVDTVAQPPLARQRYIFHVGNNAFYKNRAGVLRTLADLQDQPDLQLILAGPPPTAELQQWVDQLQLNSRVHWLINPDDATIAQHYQHAALLLFPSLYEGFGWPPLEAMAHNCPVVCSQQGSLPEVVGNAALTAAADDHEQLAEHCRTLLHNPKLADEYRQRGQQRLQHFTLAQFADQLINTYQAMDN